MNTNWLKEPLENAELKQFKKDLNTLIECIDEIVKNNFDQKEEYEEFKKHRNGLNLFKKLYNNECDIFLKMIEDRPNNLNQLIILRNNLEQVESILEEKDILKTRMASNCYYDGIMMTKLMEDKYFYVNKDYSGTKKVFDKQNLCFYISDDYTEPVEGVVYLVNFSSLKDYLLNLEEVHKNWLLWTKIHYPFSYIEKVKEFKIKKWNDTWIKNGSSVLIRTPLLEKLSHYHLISNYSEKYYLKNNRNEKEIKQEIENIKKDVKQIVEETNLDNQHVIGYEQIDFDNIWLSLEKPINDFFNNYDLINESPFDKLYLKHNCKETKRISKDEKERILNKVFGPQKAKTLEM